MHTLFGSVRTDSGGNVTQDSVYEALARPIVQQESDSTTSSPGAETLQPESLQPETLAPETLAPERL